MDLTPEEKQRIYLEEKARVEAQEKVKSELQGKKTLHGCGTGCLVVFGIFFFISFLNFLGRQSSPSKAETDARPAARSVSAATARAAKPKPAKPKPEPKWRTVGKWNGRSSKNTETFHIPDHEWIIAWNTGPGENDGNFSIIVKTAEGQYKDLVANVIGKDTGESYMRGTGDYYLEISATQPYGVIVSALY